MAAIEITNLTRSFDGLKAVDGLTLRIDKGEIFGLVGPDGAGKTTTLRMLCGLLNPDYGQATVAGHDTVREAEAVRDRIGYMAQRFGMYPDLTVEENMIFYADLFGVTGEARRRLMTDLLRMTRMEPFRKRQAAKLSGGMKQKLALMCSLLHRPEVLFLDEPTNGVDPVSRRDFWRILYQLVRDGLTVLVATAYLDEAERCNRVGLMHRGKLIRVDAPKVLRASLAEPCYAVSAPDARAVGAALRETPGVVSADPAGAEMHVFFDPRRTTLEAVRSAAGADAVFREILPSLEDVFIALIRKQEAA
ncbi:MAG: ABC transporter ATP-binding protein [Bryobacteraceae bacterium]|nr:ABC transporter ATP-binding protein [Bryobacteraceae bacterium]